MPHDRDNASCFVLDHHKTDVHSRIQPGHSRRPGNPTRPGQRGRPGDPSQTDHQQANTHHTINRLHTKRLSSTVRITGTEELTLISEPIAPRSPVHPMGTPVMAYDLWGESPLYENENLKVGRIPTVTLIDQVLDEGNCGEVTNRGEEACECAVKLTKVWEVSAFCDGRRQPHSRQSCEVTDRNSRPTLRVGARPGVDR